MKLTKSTDFALRLLIHLALDRKQHNMPELSEKIAVPYNHLTKLVQALSKAQILQTKQGKNGGITLDEEPDKINLKDVLYVTEGPTQLVECFDEDSHCILDHSCQLKMAFMTVQEKIDHFFETITLQDLMGDQKNCSCDPIKEKISNFM